MLRFSALASLVNHVTRSVTKCTELSRNLFEFSQQHAGEELDITGETFE